MMIGDGWEKEEKEEVVGREVRKIVSMYILKANRIRDSYVGNYYK